MKKLLVILLLVFLAHGAWADHDDIYVNPGGKFDDGFWFPDPTVGGCIYDEHRKGLLCGDWRYNEGKVKGSFQYALDRCYGDLNKAGRKKYRGFSSKIKHGDWTIFCDYDSSQ